MLIYDPFFQCEMGKLNPRQIFYDFFLNLTDFVNLKSCGELRYKKMCMSVSII